MPVPSIESAFRQKCAAVAGHSRIYPDQIPQAQTTWPCGIYQLIGSDGGSTLTGGRSRLQFVTFSVELWADDTLPAAREAARALRERFFDAFAGANCRGDWSGLFVTGAMASDQSAEVEPIDAASENMVRIERFKVDVHYRKPAE